MRGEDLIIRDRTGELRSVQLKGRPTVDWPTYGQNNIWMLFPDPDGPIPGRRWYLIPHNTLYAWVKDRHGSSPKWEESWSYSYISEALSQFLEKYSHVHW